MKFLLFLFLLLPFNVSGHNEELLTNLNNIPANELALCKVKSNDFVFFCALNKRIPYNCKVGLGMKFTLPKCKPISEEKTEPISEEKPKVTNPLLDLLLKKK